VDEELGHHLEMRARELREQGVPADEALAEARRRFGDLEETRQYCRQQDHAKERHMERRLRLDDLAQDVKVSIRSLARVPVLTLTIIGTVGVGIGATTAIFAAVDAALLRPLPYADPDRLVRLYTDAPPFQFRFSVADYLALEAEQTQFESIATFTDRAMTFTDGVTAELLPGRLVTWTYFPLLGITPVLGPGFTKADGVPGAPPSVIISHGFWQQRLGGRSDVIGLPIRLDGQDYRLAGVLPPLHGPLGRTQEFFVAAQFSPPPRKGPFFYTVIARLASGATAGTATDEMRAINRRMFPIWKTSYQDDKATWSLMSLHEYVAGEVGTMAGLALAAVALVWLIACANASSLLIARVTSRRRELAMRGALGASRSRVVRHLLTESAVLAVGAVALGAFIAWAGMAILQSAGSAYFPRAQEIAFDGRVAWLLAALTVGSAALFGLVPAAHGTGASGAASLLSSGRTSTAAPRAQRLRALLVGGQFAIATPLLIVAGLLLMSLAALKQVDLGFDSRNIVTGSIRLPGAAYADRAQVNRFWDDLERRWGALPGVVGVAFADGRPPDGVGNHNNFDLEEHPTPPGQSQPTTPWVNVTPTYFRVLGLRHLEGRLLDERDAQAENLESVVVDRAWAKRFFPNESAVGKRLREGGCTTCPWTTVVGVVSEVKYTGLEQQDPGTVYTAMSGSLVRFFVVRTSLGPASLVSSIRQTVRDLEPAAPLSSVATVEDLVAESLDQPQSLSALVAVFAGVAVLLSIVGIYGVMAYYVQQHAKDIGIRLALGGSVPDVLRLVVGQGMAVVVGGVVLGVVAALGVVRWISSLLFGVGATDAATFTSVPVLLVLVALAACLIPATKAVGVQPAAVLRND
jgi:predicted permease